MNFCYCVGGTGARVAEAAAHLCAMNMITGDDKDITFFIVDKDQSCGGTEKAKSMLEAITNLADVDSDGNNKNALKRSNAFPRDQQKYYFCRSSLKFSEDWNFTKAMGTLINEERGGKNATNLKSMITEDNLSDRDDQIILNAFYSKEEQEQENEGGFYGHPSVGALTFKYMSKKGKWATEKSRCDIAQPVTDYLNKNASSVANVFIIGSVFGGTGASVFPNLAAQIRNSVDKKITDSSEKLVISGVLLLPYFGVHNEKVEDAKIDSNEFYSKTIVALEQYGRDKNMMRTEDNEKGYFDSLYICGQQPLHYTGDYAECGSNQKNHFDLVDVVAARAMVEFFSNPSKAQSQPGKIYIYRFTDADTESGINSVDFSGIVEMKRDLSTMLYFSAFVITKVYGVFITNKDDPENVNIFDATYNVQKELKAGLFGKYTNKEYDDIRDNANNFLENIYTYCKNYVKMMQDISYNGRDWGTTDETTTDYRADYKFFNIDYIDNLIDICNLIDARKIKPTRIGTFCKRRDYIAGEESGIEFDEMVISLKSKFNKNIIKRYQEAGTEPQKRFSDYLHEAYNYCYEYFNRSEKDHEYE